MSNEENETGTSLANLTLININEQQQKHLKVLPTLHYQMSTDSYTLYVHLSMNEECYIFLSISIRCRKSYHVCIFLVK